MLAYGQCTPAGPLNVPGIPTPTAPVTRAGRDARLYEARPARTVMPVAEPQARDIRAWAIANGHRVGTKGAIPSHIRNAYQQALTTKEGITA